MHYEDLAKENKPITQGHFPPRGLTMQKNSHQAYRYMNLSETILTAIFS